jgi:hypothetical protein
MKSRIKILNSLFFVLLITFPFLIGCKSKCDCSYQNYKKIREGMNNSQVGKILLTKPSKEKTDGLWLISTYKCDDDFIVVVFDSERIVREISFNTVID